MVSRIGIWKIIHKSLIRLSNVYRCIHFFRKTIWKNLYTFSYTQLLQDLFRFSVYKCIHFIIHYYIILYYLFILLLLLCIPFFNENKVHQCFKIGFEMIFIFNRFLKQLNITYFHRIHFCIQFNVYIFVYIFWRN